MHMSDLDLVSTALGRTREELELSSDPDLSVLRLRFKVQCPATEQLPRIDLFSCQSGKSALPRSADDPQETLTSIHK
jgi:hypothetical protein